MDTDDKESISPPIDSLPALLHRFEPTWRTDGYGVRGPQDERPQERVQASPMNFETSYPHSGSDGGAERCTPPAPDTSKIYVKATHFVGGRWQCYWIETTTCPP